jgi:hypothetical protein
MRPPTKKSSFRHGIKYGLTVIVYAVPRLSSLKKFDEILERKFAYE